MWCFTWGIGEQNTLICNRAFQVVVLKSKIKLAFESWIPSGSYMVKGLPCLVGS